MSEDYQLPEDLGTYEWFKREAIEPFIDKERCVFNSYRVINHRSERQFARQLNRDYKNTPWRFNPCRGIAHGMVGWVVCYDTSALTFKGKLHFWLKRLYDNQRWSI